MLSHTDKNGSAGVSDEQQQGLLPAEQLPRESEQCDRGAIEADLADAKLLQRISAELIHDDGVESLYEKLLGAAVTVMRSDFASMQMLYPERGDGGELRLLAFRGFDPEAAKFWEWVRTDSACTCGVALRTGQRCIAPDVANCELMAGSDDQATYLRSGILAVLSTPLMSRSGKVVGMISTHWRTPHEPAERDLRLLDIIARQAADLIERARAKEELREADVRKGQRLLQQRKLLDLFAVLRFDNQSSAESLHNAITEHARELIGAHQAVTSLTVGRDWSQAINALSLSEKYAAYRTALPHSCRAAGLNTPARAKTRPAGLAGSARYLRTTARRRAVCFRAPTKRKRRFRRTIAFAAPMGSIAGRSTPVGRDSTTRASSCVSSVR